METEMEEAKGLRVQGRIEEWKAAAVRVRTVVRAVSVLAALLQVLRDLITIADAITEAMADREMDSENLARVKDLRRRILSRMPKSTEMKKSAVSVRKRINVPGRTSCTRRKRL